MKIVGLTGSIATGKSTVAEMFRGFGFYIVDADELAHSVYKKNEAAYFRIIEKFGKSVLNEKGEIDRKKLGDLVIRDKEKLKIIENIVHPAVEVKREEIFNEIRKKDPNARVIYDVPLLFEKNLKDKFDCVVVVYCPPALQIQRLMIRDGISKSEALKKLDLQLSIEEKRRMADIVIDNSGSLEDTYKQVMEIVKRIDKGYDC